MGINKKTYQFIAYDSERQEEVDKLVEFLLDCGMKRDDIVKLGEYLGLFTINDFYKLDIVTYTFKKKKGSL